ncbi:TetR family transcriptional regulator [Stenotrophomonas sp. S41]|uniref:TetR/AcrR family transcriptional regulator n=1 Tax=Stenotrophomonas sp. S41 TaxID=2767464 RepID=UPI00190BDCD1|nr:TetR family transcriptional regulator [Stenotrophomonas sp. S41]MBK0013670.1 TetR family transcriptional regulator [Stenotrophomonas sp. S41]
MPRASKEQAERNRERVVETAARLFRERGVENVSIGEVMAEAGLTHGGFYKQFESKEALINEAFALAFSQSSRTWDEVTRRVARAEAPATGLNALVKHYLKERPLEQACPMLAFSSTASTSEVSAGLASSYRRGTEALYAQFKREMQQTLGASVEPDELETQTNVMFSAMVGAAMLGRAMGDTPLSRALAGAITASASASASDAGD